MRMRKQKKAGRLTDRFQVRLGQVWERQSDIGERYGDRGERQRYGEIERHRIKETEMTITTPRKAGYNGPTSKK